MSTKTIYTVYKTTNTTNNKIYIGVHKQHEDEPLLDYLGSGVYFTRAVEKYGKENFTKDILFIFDNLEDMNLMEEYLVDQEFVDREDTYNLQTGGGSIGILSEESKKKIGDTLRDGYASGRIDKPVGNTVPYTEEEKQKISDILKKRYEDIDHHRLGCDPWNKGKKLHYDVWNKGLKMCPNSEESNKSRSDTLKKRYETQDGNRKGCDPWNKGKPNPYAKTEQLNTKRFECEYCGKITNKGNYTRWHSDNCKYKPNIKMYDHITNVSINK